MIQVQNISKSYNDIKVLHNISFDIPVGKMTALIGENGAGKSTLLSILSRLIKPDTGTILIDKQDIHNYKSNLLAQRISVLKQSHHLSLKLTVRELVCFGRFPYSKGKLTQQDQAIVEGAIAYLDLTNIQHRYIDELSGGQQQRAYLAMVVAQNTDYILLDEPLNNLDMKHSVKMMKTLRQLCDECGKTIVIVIHDINFASFYADYIAVLKNKELKHFGTTNTIINEKLLKDIFDINFDILMTNNKKICNYFE